MNKILSVGVSCACLALCIGIAASKRFPHLTRTVSTGGYIPITAPSGGALTQAESERIALSGPVAEPQGHRTRFPKVARKDGEFVEGDLILNQPFSASEPWSTYKLEGLYTTQDVNSLAGNRRWKGVDLTLSPMPQEGDTSVHWKTTNPIAFGNRGQIHLWFMVLLIHPDPDGGFDAASGHAYHLQLDRKRVTGDE